MRVEKPDGLQGLISARVLWVLSLHSRLARFLPPYLAQHLRLNFCLALIPTLLVAIISAGCAGAKSQRPAHLMTHVPVAHSGSALTEIIEAGYLCTNCYADNHGQIEPILEANGYKAMYFAPHCLNPWYDHNPLHYWRIFYRYPKVVAIYNTNWNYVTLVFIGTEKFGDFIMDSETSGYEDNPKTDYFYIPPGHAGFRGGILNLISQHYFTNCLLKFCMTNNVPRCDGKYKVRLVGHSLGAGLAQMAIGVTDGLRYDHTLAIQPDKTWPFSFRNAVLFAPPYALSRTNKNPDCSYATGVSLEQFVERYQTNVLNIIRDDDMVPRLYNPLNRHGLQYVPLRHFGRIRRIDQTGTLESETWTADPNAPDNTFPHQIDSYLDAIDK